MYSYHSSAIHLHKGEIIFRFFMVFDLPLFLLTGK